MMTEKTTKSFKNNQQKSQFKSYNFAKIYRFAQKIAKNSCIDRENDIFSIHEND